MLYTFEFMLRHVICNTALSSGV